MKIINIRESLLQMDRDTYGRHELTTMYESLSLSEEKKKELVKYIDAYDIDATNKFLGNEFSSQGLMEYYEDDDFSDEELASIYGGDTKYDYGVLDDVETPEETEARLNEDTNETDIKTDVKNELEKFMLDIGFDTRDIEDYTVVEIKPVDDNMLQVEVRAELGYDDITKLSDKLNTVIQKYDVKAYFEPVMPGIIEAFIRMDQSGDEVDEETVKHWTDIFNSCESIDDLRSAYEQYKAERDLMSEGTIDAIGVVIDLQIDLLTVENKNESLREQLIDEGIFGKIGNAIKNKAKQIKNDNVNNFRMTQRKAREKKHDDAMEYKRKDMEKGTANQKDLLQGEDDINRGGKDKEELADMDRKVSGPKIASAPDYSQNKKGTNKTGKDLEKAISDATKRGEVYIADIGESLQEDFIDDDISFFKDEYEVNDDIVNDYTFKATKSIPDSDGFNTDYTWYECADGTHVFVFGDNDIYKPEDGYFDHVCDSETEAQEWFDSYKGFNYNDDDLDEAVNDTTDKWEIEYNNGAVQRCPMPNETKVVEGTWEDVLEELESMYVDIPGEYDDDDNPMCSLEQFVNEYEDNADLSGSTVLLRVTKNGEVVFEISDYEDWKNSDEDDWDDDLDEAKKRSGSLLDKVNKALKEDSELSTDHAVVSIVDEIKRIYELGGFEKLPVGRENALTKEISGPDKERIAAYFEKQPEFKMEINTESGITSYEFISDKYDVEVFDSFVQMYKIPQTESLTEDTEKVYMKKNGDYLIKGDNGGYQAFNANDVHLGHISEEDAKEAIFKFEKNNFDEALEEETELKESSLLDKVNAALAKEDSMKM